MQAVEHEQERRYRGDLWDLYIVDHIHLDSKFWTPNWIFKLLAEKGFKDLEVVAPRSVADRHYISEQYVSVKITGECHDGEATVDIDLYKDDMTLEQRQALVSYVRDKYRQPKDRTLREAVARALTILLIQQ